MIGDIEKLAVDGRVIFLRSIVTDEFINAREPIICYGKIVCVAKVSEVEALMVIEKDGLLIADMTVENWDILREKGFIKLNGEN
jgi:hypothetical protein